jgi:hypothetical protein
VPTVKIVCVFLISTLFGNVQNPDVLFVSLGSHCEVAGRLKGNQLREASFPFDWLLSVNHELFVQLLHERFQYFLEEQYFFQRPKEPHIVGNAYYKIEFWHDWPFPTLSTDEERYAVQLREIKEKYQRRIERFLRLNEYPGRVYFIRAAYDLSLGTALFWGKEGAEQIERRQAEELKAALDGLFPSLDFKLVILNYGDQEIEPIEGLDGILECRIKKSQKDIDYQRLFSMLIEQNAFEKLLKKLCST